MTLIDIIVGIIAILSAFVSCAFWLAAREIKDDVFASLNDLKHEVNNKLERIAITSTARLQNTVTRNIARITNTEARLGYIEEIIMDDKAYDRYKTFVVTLEQGLPDESTGFRE